MEIEEMLHELHKAVKTSDDEIMCLPFGNSSPNEVVDWLVNLSDEDFITYMECLAIEINKRKEEV